MPVVTVILGVSAPLYRSLPVPDESVPTAKCVTVLELPAHAGKVMAAAFVQVLVLTVQPPAVRATATRAYAVYADSDVVWVPASPGSAVCSETYKLPAVAEFWIPAASPIRVISAFWKMHNSKSFSKAFDLDMVLCYP